MTRINERIRSLELRVIDADGQQLGIISRDQALQTAKERELDLVEISPTAKPPVCKIMDYGKFKYEQSKREKDSRKKQHVVHVKEIRLRPRIDQHDFEFKLKSAIKFLEEGNKVKVSLIFRGREMAHRELGYEVMQQVEKYLADTGKPETPVRAEGRMLVAIYTKK